MCEPDGETHTAPRREGLEAPTMGSCSERAALLPGTAAYGGGEGLHDSEDENVPVLVRMEGNRGGGVGVGGVGYQGGGGGRHASSSLTRGTLIALFMGVALISGIALGVFCERISLTSAAGLSEPTVPEGTPIVPEAIPEGVVLNPEAVVPASSSFASSSRPYIHVGFQAAGDVVWLALTKLIELAPPRGHPLQRPRPAPVVRDGPRARE